MKHLLIAAGIVAALASQAMAQDRSATPRKMPPVQGSGSGWLVGVTLELIGAAFPTLPEPYVSVELRTMAALDGASVTSEARTATTQRVTLSPAEARALGEALIAWADDPAVTTTLLSKSY